MSVGAGSVAERGVGVKSSFRSPAEPLAVKSFSVAVPKWRSSPGAGGHTRCAAAASRSHRPAADRQKSRRSRAWASGRFPERRQRALYGHAASGGGVASLDTDPPQPENLRPFGLIGPPIVSAYEIW